MHKEGSEPMDLELQVVVSHFVSQRPCKSNTHSTTESSFQSQIFFKHLFIYLVPKYMWRSETNFGESVLSFHRLGPGIRLREAGLASSTFTL